MKETINHYRKGYLLIRLQGFSPERFLNLCMNNQIEIWDLRCREKGYEYYIALEGFRKVRPLVRKASVRLKVLERYGLPFFLHRNRKRKLYALGIACFFLLLFVMSQFIWNITLEGNYRFTDDMLLHYLDEQEIRYGVRRSVIDCDNLEEGIRTAYPEIIWVSARISGTRLMIKIKENEVMASIPVKDDTACDLVADKDGIITSIVVRRGKAQVKVGDTVAKGQVLVSGIIPIYNDATELVNQQYVCADADIQAETRDTYNEFISHWTTQRMDTGRTRYGVLVRILQYSAVFLMPAFQDHQWEFVKENRQVTLMGDFYLPLWITQMKGREYETYERFLTLEELEQKKNDINQLKMQNLLEKGVQILTNSVRIEDNSSGWQIIGEFVIDEPIGIRQSLNYNLNQAEEKETTG